MKIFFLHGLESNHQSSKVKHMREHGHDVLAPEMNYYDNEELYQQTLVDLLLLFRL
jgi:hypothetical protein